MYYSTSYHGDDTTEGDYMSRLDTMIATDEQNEAEERTNTCLKCLHVEYMYKKTTMPHGGLHQMKQ